jgi:hypothetical protein
VNSDISPGLGSQVFSNLKLETGNWKRLSFMTELELQHLRREKWRVEGEPIRTLEEARQFVDSVGMCLLYPAASILLPTFIAATIGSDHSLPTRKTAVSDSRAKHAEELLVRLVREKYVFEAQVANENLLLSPDVFPYFYALASDRQPRQPIRSRERGKASPLTEHVFRKLEERGAMTEIQLREELGGALSQVGLDRALVELRSALKIVRTARDADAGDTWDLYYRWAPDAVNQGVRISDGEALSALISKYLDALVAATQEEIEAFFSKIASRARVTEVVRALLAAREFTYTPSETRTLITVAHSREEAAPKPTGDARMSGPRRRNG